jgi:uncharacterized phage-associated protein
MNNGYLATPAQVANVVLTLTVGKNDIYLLTPYKLGKLVYMAYAWYYVLTGKKLFDSSPKLGENGPVIEEIDSQFAKNRNNIIPIEARASTYDVDRGEELGELSIDNKEHQIIINIVNTVLSFYKDLHDGNLKKLTHEEGSVWSIANDNGLKIGDSITDMETIKQRAEIAIKKCIEAKRQQVKS